LSVTTSENRFGFLWIWLAWLSLFYGAWLLLMRDPKNAAAAFEHGPIALTMLFGSYVAGSTPMGGGTVAFPILVLAYGLPVTLGRDFSFAIQSIGMTSAAIFILCRRQQLAWAMLCGTMAGSMLGLPLGILLVAPHIPTIWVKLLFAVFWAAFGVLHLARLDDLLATTGNTGKNGYREFSAGVLIGAVAGVSVVAVTGVGVDMLIYAVLVLACRVDPKVAIPTSVVAMAFNSVLGTAIKQVTTGIESGVWGNWLAAAPVVALGAPLGAFVVGLIGRRLTLLFVAILCVMQFAWACYHERVGLGLVGVTVACVAVLVCVYVLDRLHILGMKQSGLISQRSSFCHSSVPDT
jgi:uncharacterized membrane protein YfcA